MSDTAASPTPVKSSLLRRDTLDIRHAIVISVAVMSPAASVFFNTIPQGALVGAAIPLCTAIGFVIALLVANSYSEFSREIPSSGSSYTYITQGLGPRFGFMSAWVGLMAVTLGVPYSFVLLSANLQTIVARAFGLNLHWSFWFVLLLGLAFAICYSGIRQSLNVDLTFLAFEIAICLVLAGIVLFKVGQQGGLTATPFNPNAIPAAGGFATNLIGGVIFGVLSFIGFETAAALGEETKHPHRNIPRAVFGSMIIVGLFYILMTYTETVGYGMDKIFTDFNNPNTVAPFDTISRHFGGEWFALLIDLVGVLSFFSAAIAIINGSARILLTIASEGLLPHFLTYLHPTRKTPVGTITALCVMGGIIGLALGFALNPNNAFTFLGILDALFVLIIYGLVCVGSMRFFWRKRRTQFSLMRHGIMPMLGTLIITTIFVLVFVLAAAPPLNLIPFILGAWVLIGGILIVALRKRIAAVGAG